jgi:hypothetical protein
MYYRDYSVDKYAKGGKMTEFEKSRPQKLREFRTALNMLIDEYHAYIYDLDDVMDGFVMMDESLTKRIGNYAKGGMMANGGKMTNSGISADIGRMYKGDRKKIKFIYVIHKRDEYHDIIPKPVKKMSVVRVNEETAKEVVYKKYPSRNYFVELEDAFYVK